MEYIELNIETDPELFEMLTAQLAELNFESFLDDLTSMQAYVQQEQFLELETKQLLEDYASKAALHYTLKVIPKQNWNEEWEKNFNPIVIADQIYVRADFHPATPDGQYKHQIVVTPKMSFGTGHHETTSMVMQHQLGIDHSGKTVLDIGCGTGILAILAEKLGASQIGAFDNDEWCQLNSQENVDLNGCQKIEVRLGTIETEPEQQYDILLANINRNILLAQIPVYVQFMKHNACLVVSGFFASDGPDIVQKAKESGLAEVRSLQQNNWMSIVFEKIG